MKRIRIWILVIAALILSIDWNVMGIKLFSGNYNITIEACISLICLAIILVCAVSKLLTDKCSNCGKLRVSNGKYFSHCGKEL